MTTDEFIIKAKLVHGDRYDYSLVDYVNAKTNIIIMCSIHGKFKQNPRVHLRGSGCQQCGKNKSLKAARSIKINWNDYVKKANDKHNNKYQYLEEGFENKKIKIICPVHGEFMQNKYDHLNGRGCRKCYNATIKLRDASNTIEFIKKAKKIHGDRYDYTSTNYNTAHVKIKIQCPIHGMFIQTPHQHLRGEGCPRCKKSKGELSILKFLQENNIPFTEQKTFNECADKQKLQFDFYLPDHNTCIEFDGIQHFKPIQAWGGNQELLNIQRRDRLKNDFCNKNNINLLRIKYNEKVESKLRDFFAFL